MFFDIDSKSLSVLSPKDSIALFTRLLWSSAYRHRVPVSAITISTKIDVPDGGIDADISRKARSTDSDLLTSGNSFFQIKAGTTAAPWQMAWIKNELLGPSKKLGNSVLQCVKSKGRYVLVCFGCDPTGAQRRTATAHIKHVFTKFGFRHARVDVWGQSTLLGHIHTYPSLTLLLGGYKDLQLLTHDDWKQDATMQVKLHLGDDQNNIVGEIRQLIRRDEIRHIRLLGEPGLGKTRIVLEALSSPDLAPVTIYARSPEDFESTPLFNSLLRSDNFSSLILVVDDCQPKDRATIWNALRERSNRIRLITLDHGPDSSQDSLMKILHCPVLGLNQIKEILSDYVDPQGDLDRWAAFCSGSPRVAHAVGQNLRSNPNDLTRSPATVPIWQRFIHGNTQSDTAESRQHELVLHHIALFQKFGFEKPVEDEAKFISSLIESVDRNVTWGRFQAIVKHYRERRILQGKSTLFLVPKLLHIYLWLQWWEHYGYGADLKHLISQMPPTLFRWFGEMFKYGHASIECLRQIEDLLGDDGPFNDVEFIARGKGAGLLSEIAEAHPEATLRRIERFVGDLADHSLLTHDARQQLVHTLEKLAIWKVFFTRSAKLLLSLSVGDESTYSNNAAGTFCELFEMGYDRMASTEAPPDARLEALRSALDSEDASIRSVGRRALARALADHPHMKQLGAERQGMLPIPSLWMPKTWGEVWNAYGMHWQIAHEHWKQQLGDEKNAASKLMCDAAFFVLTIRPLENTVLESLKALANEPNADSRPLIHFLVRQRRSNWRGLSRNAARALRQLDATLAGTDLFSNVVRWVICGTWDDGYSGRAKDHGKSHSAKLTRLAHQLISKPVALQKLLPRLFTEPSVATQGFGHLLADADDGFSQLPAFLSEFIAAGERRIPDLLVGYLIAMFYKSRDKWEAIALQILENEFLRANTRELVVGTGITEPILDRVCRMAEQGTVLHNALSAFGFVQRRAPITVERSMQFISWCLSVGGDTLIASALNTAHRIFREVVDPSPPMPLHPILELISASVGVENEMNYASFQWHEITEKFVAEYPAQSMPILESILRRFDNHDFARRIARTEIQNTISNLIRSNPRQSWRIVSELLVETNSHRAHGLAWMLAPIWRGFDQPAGLLSAFDPSDVLEWIDGDVSKRAPLIARESPKSFEPVIGALTRQILVRYGHLDGVRSALWCTFGTESIQGKGSEHYRKKREKFQEWLRGEKEPAIIQWLENYISYLTNTIREREIREEREFDSL